jgi:hypothetical protein
MNWLAQAGLFHFYFFSCPEQAKHLHSSRQESKDIQYSDATNAGVAPE